ncbi:MAG: hypothetical protein ACFFCI_05795 [Promethearchaeota archaeon]
MILTRIYYKINYKGDIQNFENIIEKSELFEYQKYCKYRDSWGEGPINNSEYYRIDKKFIDTFKIAIEEDKTKFHLNSFYSRSFLYSVEVTDESLVYLTYNNNSIIKAEYDNCSKIFTANCCWDYCYNRYTSNWDGNWYLNFTLIPLASNMSTTIMLHDIYLVKMFFQSEYHCGFQCTEFLRIEQFLCYNSKFQMLFVYFPLVGMVVA